MNTIYTNILATLFFSGVAAGPLFAQAGNDNPTGNAGEFEGSGIVTTGCHYNNYTGSATHSVTDLAIAGVGTYPLAFTRTSNSRGDVGNLDFGGGLADDFGRAGNWVHSYQWSIDSKLQVNGGIPSKAVVYYPDGRVTIFVPSTNGDPYYRGGPGVRDRLQFFWDSSTAGRAYLIMPDGGKVWFSIAISHPSGDGSSAKQYDYTVQGIIDPHGQTTTIVGSPATGLVTITEPAGRWIKLYYRTITSSTEGWVYYPSDKIIDHITASDGRSVQYTYTAFAGQTSLINVTYYNDPTFGGYVHVPKRQPWQWWQSASFHLHRPDVWRANVDDWLQVCHRNQSGRNPGCLRTDPERELFQRNQHRGCCFNPDYHKQNRANRDPR